MRPPKNRGIALEPGADIPDWFLKVKALLDAFMSDTVAALDRGLTRADNFRVQKKQLDFTTGPSVAASFPMRISCELPTRPERITPGQSVALNGGTFAGAVDTSQWNMLDGTTIQLSNITGLNPSTRYQITLFIE